MQLMKQVEDFAKVAAMKHHFSPGIEGAFAASLDNPGFYDHLVASLGAGSEDTFSDVSGFLGDEARSPLLTDGFAIAAALEYFRDEYIRFFLTSLKSVFVGIDPGAVQAAIGNVSEHAANEVGWFSEGDGSEQANSADISKAIDRVGDLLDMVGHACENQAKCLESFAVPKSIESPLSINNRDRNTILASLRYYQQQGMGDPANRSGDIQDIATDGDSALSMDGQDIDDLCERINIDFAPILPRVLIIVSRGLADYVCDNGIDVEIFDRDNYNAGDGHLCVPARFKDLADPIDVPVEKVTPSASNKM